MTPQEMYVKQLEKWVELTVYFIDDTVDKSENDITKTDIIAVAQKIEDIQNVLTGKSKISGWRL